MNQSTTNHHNHLGIQKIIITGDLIKKNPMSVSEHYVLQKKETNVYVIKQQYYAVLFVHPVHTCFADEKSESKHCYLNFIVQEPQISGATRTRVSSIEVQNEQNLEH